MRREKRRAKSYAPKTYGTNVRWELSLPIESDSRNVTRWCAHRTQKVLALNLSQRAHNNASCEVMGNKPLQPPVTLSYDFAECTISLEFGQFYHLHVRWAAIYCCLAHFPATSDACFSCGWESSIFVTGFQFYCFPPFLLHIMSQFAVVVAHRRTARTVLSVMFCINQYFRCQFLITGLSNDRDWLNSFTPRIKWKEKSRKYQQKVCTSKNKTIGHCLVYFLLFILCLFENMQIAKVYFFVVF